MTNKSTLTCAILARWPRVVSILRTEVSSCREGGSSDSSITASFGAFCSAQSRPPLHAVNRPSNTQGTAPLANCARQVSGACTVGLAKPSATGQSNRAAARENLPPVAIALVICRRQSERVQAPSQHRRRSVVCCQLSKAGGGQVRWMARWGRQAAGRAGPVSPAGLAKHLNWVRLWLAGSGT